jgi:surfactin synthase thioesterase subunit
MTAAVASAPGKPASARGRLTCSHPQPQARSRLVCFAHAGGGPAAYRRWSSFFAPHVEVWTAILPGRAARCDEPFERSWERLVEQFADALIRGDGTAPAALLGHSLGGLVAYEVGRSLDRHGTPPRHLFVSGSRAPHRLDSRWPIPHDDGALITEVDTRYGGVPAAVRAAPELLERFVPVLRADLELAASYVFRPGPRLSCPITALGGRDDKTAPPPEIEGWRDHTDRAFDAVTLPGAHFFIHSELPTVATLVRRALSGSTARSRRVAADPAS